MSKIEDFGEYLDGAAKDRARNFIGRMRHVADVEVANATLARSFPEPDYKGLIEDGADPFGVAFVRSLRESIPPKPRNRGLEMWARVVRDFRNLSERVIRGDLREEEIRATGAGPTASSGLRKAIDKADLYLIAGHDTSLKKLEFGFKRYRIDGQVAQYRENWEVAPVRRKSDRLTP
ncbi:MAG: hypothetical protein ABJN42_13490, partial [Roseibium sp.]|uniref:hypothetical protein n=1 Tax=Roseibium sp. TaxID=1936156 RepID=UPI003296A74E